MAGVKFFDKFFMFLFDIIRLFFDREISLKNKISVLLAYDCIIQFSSINLFIIIFFQKVFLKKVIFLLIMTTNLLDSLPKSLEFAKPELTKTLLPSIHL